MTYKAELNVDLKRTVIYALTSFAIFFNFSCTDFLKGKPKNQKVISYKSNKLACLSDVSNSFDNYIQTQSSESEIDVTFDCLDKTFDELQQRAEGSESSEYFTLNDIHNILEDFVPNAKINDQASTGILRFKSAVIGGQKDKLTKLEINNVRDYLKVLKVEVKKMLPYASLLNLKLEKRILSQNDINLGYLQLANSLKVLLKQSRLVQSEYGFDELSQLISDLGVVSSDQKGILNLMAEIKKVFLGSAVITAENDYHSLIDSFMGIFKLYSLNQQHYIGFSFNDPQQLTNTINSAFDLIDILENSLQYKKTQMISADSLDSLINVLLQKNLVSFVNNNSDKNLLNLPITAETLKVFYKSIFVKIFDAGRAGDRNNFQGLTKKHFDNLKRELAIYKTYSNAIEQMPWQKNENDGLSIDLIRIQLKNYNPIVDVDLFKRFDALTQKDILAGFEDLKSEFFYERPVLYKNKKMVIAADQQKLTQNWQDLAFSTFNKLLARMLVLGWSERNSANNRVGQLMLSSNSLIDWYTDFKDIGIELKMFDPRQKNTGGKSFLEANLFTFAGNGDDQMNYLEAAQYLNMITSGGGRTVGELQEGLVSSGCDLTNQEKDVFGYFWKSEPCFVNEFRKNFRKYYGYLPYMTGYIENLNDKQFKFFYNDLMTVARTNSSNKDIKIEYSDLRNISMLLSYIESLFAVADLNYNWTVTDHEIRYVYPRFRSFATDYANRVSKDKLEKFKKWNQCSNYIVDDLIRESFIFLVYNGRPPEMSDINYISCFFGNELISFDGEVDRARIISTFKVLKEVLDSKSK